MRPIDADEALRLKDEDLNWVYDLTDLEEFLAGVPTLDVEPVKHGKWVETVFHNGCTFDHDMVCSVCGHSGLPEYEYCPNCGAKMLDEGEGE